MKASPVKSRISCRDDYLGMAGARNLTRRRAPTASAGAIEGLWSQLSSRRSGLIQFSRGNTQVLKIFRARLGATAADSLYSVKVQTEKTWVSLTDDSVLLTAYEVVPQV